MNTRTTITQIITFLYDKSEEETRKGGYMTQCDKGHKQTTQYYTKWKKT